MRVRDRFLEDFGERDGILDSCGGKEIKEMSGHVKGLNPIGGGKLGLED